MAAFAGWLARCIVGRKAVSQALILAAALAQAGAFPAESVAPHQVTGAAAFHGSATGLDRERDDDRDDREGAASDGDYDSDDEGGDDDELGDGPLHAGLSALAPSLRLPAPPAAERPAGAEVTLRSAVRRRPGLARGPPAT